MKISRLFVRSPSCLRSIMPIRSFRYYDLNKNKPSVLEQEKTEEFIRDYNYYNQTIHKSKKEINHWKEKINDLQEETDYLQEERDDLIEKFKEEKKNTSFLTFIIFILSCMLVVSSSRRDYHH